jgi:hypothetical protein
VLTNGLDFVLKDCLGFEKHGGFFFNGKTLALLLKNVLDFV